MRMNKDSIGHPCPRCKRPITEEVVASLHQGRSQHSKNLVKKLRAEGKLTGRKRKRDDALIWSLRKAGKSYKEIREITGDSEMTICRSIRETKQKEQAFWRENSEKSKES